MARRDGKKPGRRDVPLSGPEDELLGLDELPGMGMRETIPYELPSGHVVECMDEAELRLCKETARPYREVGAQIPDEAWIQIKGYLELILLKERTLAQTRGHAFMELDTKSKKEVSASIVALNGEINEFSRRLDPLKNTRGDDGLTPAEWRADVMGKALDYAQSHLGEFTWLAICPNPDCRHNNEPFMMMHEMPHFAMDPAAGPGVIWNEQCAELVHLHYCGKPPGDCEHVAHRRGYAGTLSVADAAKILRVSPIGLIMLAWERNKYDLGFLEAIDPDVPDTLKRYIQ